MNYNNYSKSMSNFGITAVEAVGLTIPDNLSNDPVTKAVYDNILGNIPAKKKDQFSCSLCKLTFSSKTILNAHLSGSKHQKKLKSKEIMQTLSRTDPTCIKDSTGQFRCSLCNITFMAAHCLKNHSLSREHRLKKGEDVGDEEPSLIDINGAPTAIDPSTGVPLKKKERPRVSISVPDCVTKIEDTKTGGKFFCNPCQAHCNSDIQLQQHLSCKKHLEKVSGRPKPVPRWKGGLFGKQTRGKGASRNASSASSRWETTPLSTSSALLINTITSNYNQAAYPDSSLSSYTDSYGLSSLGRSTVPDYSIGKSVAGVRGGGRGAATAYGQSEMYGVTEGDYGRGTSVYGKTEAYPRTAEYSTDYHHGKVSDYSYSSYTGSGAAAAAYAAQGYSAGQSVAPRPAARSTSLYTYTQPLAQNFVSGGKIY